MSTLQNLMAGFSTALTLVNLGWAFVGVTLGTLVGILPGIGPALTIALLLPITSKLVRQRLHHVRRALLRRHVRRLDDLDPAQHPG